MEIRHSRGSIQGLCAACVCIGLALWGCGDREPPCSGASCSSASGNGGAAGNLGAAGSPDALGGAVGEEAGAPGQAEGGDSAVSGVGGEGGALPTNACQTDADCADTLACNGQEHCDAGQCRAGAALSCGAGLHCVEQGAGTASCDYKVAGRWLTFLGSDTGLFPFELRALRLEGNAHSASLSLSTAAVDATYQLIDLDTWSPDGRHLIVNNAMDIEHIDTNRLFDVDFGAGVPSAPSLLKNIPVGGSVSSGPWADDSSAVFVTNSATPVETYLVHFTPSGQRSELLFSEPDDNTDLHFCPDPRYFYRTHNGASTLVDSQHPSQEQPLWAATTYNSPDGHWLLSSGDSTGLWLATCEPGTKPTRISIVPAASGLYWSRDGRFVTVTHDTPEGEIEILDSTQKFKSVFKGTQADYYWAENSPKLVLLGLPDAKGAQTLTEVDLSTLPAKTKLRGTSPASASWGLVNDDSFWTTRDEAGGTSGCWLLDAGSNTWRRLATQLSDARPVFTANGDYAVFRNELNDGTTEILAFSLHDKAPMAISLLPAPLSGDVYLESVLNGGLIVSHFTGLEPFEGQLWWIASTATGFAKPTLLNDDRAATSPTVQPLP